MHAIFSFRKACALEFLPIQTKAKITSIRHAAENPSSSSSLSSLHLRSTAAALILSLSLRSSALHLAPPPPRPLAPPPLLRGHHRTVDTVGAPNSPVFANPSGGASTPSQTLLSPFLSPSPPQICSWRALRELCAGRPYGRGGRALRIGRSPSPVALSPRVSSFLLRRSVALDARRGRRGGPVCGRAALDARRGLRVGRPPRRGGLLDARQGGHGARDSPMGKQVAAVEEVESRGKPWRSHLLSWPPPRVVAASSSDCPQPSGGRKRLRCLLLVNGTMVPVSGFLVVNFVAQLVR